MSKAILTILLFCFAVFTAGAQVVNTKTTGKNQVEQNKIQKEKVDKSRADDAIQEVKNQNAPVIAFDKMVHDYGTLSKGDDGNCEFKFTNEGKEPLILTNVKAS